ncbi:WD domain, g-beta repeat domain-containing protein [Pochonia chlamydosporia 170]|uniref:WD domain, g-beta repeat domain-containing protein n=1 Tax=Pochonia chlamydosporia 170 TaxID=1380566 RepID=A0A219APS1_METCM|nr:WD domain, g-beta repeat domain-containing protein [Pochonia chlamydosporia 170]OWT42609.1 WD domain, g-beta repeat domain-containing protein [Pochonia chlamydosporia 170]
MGSRLFGRITAKFRNPSRTPRPKETAAARPASTHSQTSPPDATPQSTAETTPCLTDSGSSQTLLSSLQERLWNQAYDELKASEPKALDAYETILSNELYPNNIVENEIGKTPDARCQQMQQLVQTGLDRTLKETSIKEGIGECLEVVQRMRGIVDKAIQAAPQAAVAWVGVCIGLEIISKPVTEARSNRKGIAYVLLRMDWYWNLADLLLDENKAVEASAGLRNELERHISQLYQRLLLYQIKSICLYRRNELIKISRDVFSRDDWDGQLRHIQEAEAAIQRDADQYNSAQVRKYLDNLATIAVSQEKKLNGIHSAIQDQTQQQEKRFQDEKDKQCLKDLYETNPDKDKERIEHTKGGLLRDSYLWILDNADFKQFRNDPQSRLLWIKGDPGKGKTMLLCGIINELLKKPDEVLSYFFCQATVPQLRNATSVLRGLMHLLLDKRPSLISHLRARYDTTGEKLFQGINVWGSLEEILTDMLKDPTLTDAVFVVDALDECTTDRSQLLDFIVKSSSTSHVKWIVSSRNWPEIEDKLDTAEQKVRLQLELNQNSISNAITFYIDHKVDELGRFKNYDEGTRHAVQQYLAENAKGTFLWVALVCQELAKVKKRHTLDKLRAFPPDLNLLYSQMIQHINDSEDSSNCKQILAITSVVYRPVSLQELKVLAGSLEACDQDELREITKSCGSFLTLQDDIVEFVHQSAKDYLLSEATDYILPSGISDQHHAIFLRSLKTLSQTLKRDICGLGAPGFLIDQVSITDLDILDPIRYSTTYWVDHLSDSKFTEIDHDGVAHINDFIQRKYLYWLESLSLLHCMPKGVTAVQKLEDIASDTKLQQLVELIQDARRFILSHKPAIEIAPLQLYASALVFSPPDSLVRVLFKKEEPSWVTLKSVARTNWGECLQTLEGHDDPVTSVAFSHDSKLVASASGDKTIRIWHAETGECTQTLKGHDDWVYSVAFSHDSKLVASASDDKTIRIWHAETGECTQTLEGHDGPVASVAFSHDSKLVASASRDKTIRIWHAETGECTQTLKGHDGPVYSVAFSHDSKLVASASRDETIRIWHAETGECTQATNIGVVTTILSFEPESTRLLTTNGSFTILDDTPSIFSSASPPRQLPASALAYSTVCGVSRDKRWLTLNGERALWLPVEFRPRCWAVSESTLSIGCNSGRVMTIGFIQSGTPKVFSR